jgi:hypothetical protein
METCLKKKKRKGGREERREVWREGGRRGKKGKREKDVNEH